MLQITRYHKTRFWALWDGSELVAVVVYRRARQSCCGAWRPRPRRPQKPPPKPPRWKRPRGRPRS